jgi:hypothetical protein
LEFGAAGAISLFNSCLFPAFPVRSLLRIGSVPGEKPKNADGIDVLYALVGQGVGISLYFFLLTGIFGRDGFARDWHHQTVCGTENCSLIRCESPAFRAFPRFPKIKMSIGTADKPEFWGAFLCQANRQSPFRSPQTLGNRSSGEQD